MGRFSCAVDTTVIMEEYEKEFLGVDCSEGRKETIGDTKSHNETLKLTLKL